MRKIALSLFSWHLMSLRDSFRRQFVPLHPDGYLFVAASVGITLLLFWIWSPLGWIGTLLTLWCAFFFRDPPRTTPLRDGLVLSPADGVVCAVGLCAPPPELGLGDKELLR